jgi:membrane protease YdiL (CAAX protease family)
LLCAALIVGFVAIALLRGGPRTWREFGLAWSCDHRRASLPLALLTAVAVGVLLLWGWQTGHLRQNRDVLRALAAYPLWGLVQQGLMFGFVYPRLKQAAGVRLAPVLTAVLFAAAHAPNPLLMVGGGLVVLGYGLVWQRAPSLPLLAISHGVIGAVCDKALHVSMRVGAHYFALP